MSAELAFAPRRADRRGVVAAALAVALTSAALARAEPPPSPAERAQVLFDEAFDLMEAKQYARACPLFEESLRIDPAMGTRFRLAECFERAGLVGSAWRLYGEVTVEAVNAGREDRAAQARERVDALAPRVPWLVVTAPPGVSSLPGLTVTCEGRDISVGELGRRVAIDPGSNTLQATAAGRAPFRTTLRALEGGTLEVTLPVLGPAEEKSLEPPPPRPTSRSVWRSPSGRAQRIGAIVVGAVGLGGVGVGVGAGLTAKSSWSDALDGCDGGDPSRCSKAAIDEGAAASRWAAASTTGFVVAGAALVLAPILWVTAPSVEVTDAAASRVWVVPTFASDHAGLVAGGAF